jgi:hypothetical protein
LWPLQVLEQQMEMERRVFMPQSRVAEKGNMGWVQERLCHLPNLRRPQGKGIYLPIRPRHGELSKEK